MTQHGLNNFLFRRNSNINYNIEEMQNKLDTKIFCYYITLQYDFT